jgi:hypothetical protein
MSKSKPAPPGPSRGTQSIVAMVPSTPVPPVVVDSPRVRCGRFLILTAGVVVTHLILFAPSLFGYKVLLPLNELSTFPTYLPRSAEYAGIHATNYALSDQILQFEFQRRFASQELRAGRLPLWDPYHYCGAPFVVPFLSPFNIPYYLLPNYVTLAWTHVLVGFVASSGAYVFFRRVQNLGFWPSVMAAWCLPLTGFFQYWLGFYLSFTAAFLPWLFVAVDSIVRRPVGWGGPLLALVTGSILISGALDLAGQALLAAGLFAVWRLGEQYLGNKKSRVLVAPVVALTAAWLLGFLLAAPYWMHLTEYGATGMRLQKRASNEQVERPPVGLGALPLMVAPYFDGSTWRHWPYLSTSSNLQESAAQAYCGLFATLVIAPLGFTRRRLWSLNLFWLLLSVLASAWILNLPILTAILQAPGLNLMSHNRFLFVVCFAILSLVATGLDVLIQGEVRWQSRFLIPVALIVILGLWCIERGVNIDYLVDASTRICLGDRTILGKVNPTELAVARGNLREYNFETAALCAAALALWLLVIKAPRQIAISVVSAVLIADLLWATRNENPQCDPALYYPDIPALSQLRDAPAGRVTGISCLPALMAQRFDLWDVRGYDAVDPLRMVNLLLKVKDHRSSSFDYAAVQWWWPQILPPEVDGGKPRVLPVANMLNLRYLISRSDIGDKILNPKLFESEDYFVFENTDALPRAYVPRRLEVIKEPSRILDKMTDPATARAFDPAAVVYSETDPNLPGEIRGTAELVAGETPGEVHVAVNMETPGLLVLADQWNAGWKAYLNGEALPIHRVNYALRGVAVPAGRGEVVFHYEPAGWARGIKACGIALAVVVIWALATAWLTRRRRPLPQSI